MGQSKPLASLSSGLLARKGGARPAMRRQLLGGGFEGVDPFEDDLGWNDMGHEEGPHHVQPHAGLTPMPGQEPHPVPQEAMYPAPQEAFEEFDDALAEPEETPAEAPIPAVLEERVVLARAVAEIPATKAPKAPRVPRPDTARAAKAAFTLRVDPDRHLKLRLACAISNRSAQQIVTEALDNFLNQLPELAQLADQIPQTAGKRQLG
jgi:hypothetical protein